jgi:hypothetical protein
MRIFRNNLARSLQKAMRRLKALRIAYFNKLAGFPRSLGLKLMRRTY